MIQKYFLPLLAIAGAIFGLLIVAWTQRATPVPPIYSLPSTSPYEFPIGASGLIEAASENISIASPFTEIITQVFVKKGDEVKMGDPLFQLDTRTLQAQLLQAKATSNLAKVASDNATEQFSFYERLIDKKAVSEQLYQQTYYAMLEAKENLAVAEANVKAIEVTIDRSLVKAPIDGQILQVNCHAGEIAPTIPVHTAQSTWRTGANGGLILMGDMNRLQVRIDIDSDDAWKYQKGIKATAYIRGNRSFNIPLQFIAVEPYIVPKSSFTGQTAERVDTRVLQVLYQFDKNDFPVYPGQILDVYFDAKSGGA